MRHAVSRLAQTDRVGFGESDRVIALCGEPRLRLSVHSPFSSFTLPQTGLLAGGVGSAPHADEPSAGLRDTVP